MRRDNGEAAPRICPSMTRSDIRIKRLVGPHAIYR